MRREKLMLLLFILASLNATSQQISSQWQWLNPKPSGFNNNKVCFSDNSNGFVFNDNGELMRTTDGGDHWVIHQKFPGGKAMDIHDSTGVVAGFSNSIYVSTDNGNTWQKKVVTASQNPYFPFVQAVSRDTLLALNSNDYSLLRSTDRGTTWTTILANTLLNNNLSFHFINSRIGFLGGYAGIQKTNDGGITWQPVYNDGSWGIVTIRFFNENLGYAYREDNRLLKTTDGGVTWTILNFNYFDIFSFFFTNADTIYAAGEQVRIYKSTDGGDNWTVISPNSPNGGFKFSSIYFVNDNKGFVVGSSGKILSTSDGGATWKQYGVTHNEITSLYFPSAQVAYATDWWSAYKSVDAGKTWQPSNLSLINLNSRLTHSWFRNKDTGFVISSDPAWFYKTKDGGQTWQTTNPLPAGYEKALALNFVNDTTGYLCMYNSGAGEFFKTNNGGETWNFVGVANGTFKQVEFVSAKTGYGVTDHSIFKTVDSAKTWQVALNSSNDWFNGVHFINEATGYCFGDNGVMKKTNDSGATWSTMNVPSGHIENIHFFNKQVGYMVSESLNHGVFKTYDGGATWHAEFNLVLPHTATTSDTVMYIAGGGGAILSQAIAGYNLDSLLIKNITSCSADFSGYVSVAFGSVDSIRLEYGHSGFTNLVPLTPSSVTNNTVKFVKSLQNLGQDTVYSYRLRFFYKGNYVYSDEGSFKTWSLPKPTISVISDTLISSSFFNNQWFLNGQPIAGATDDTLKVTVSGNYTVQVTDQGCLSQLSNPFNFIVTAIDPVLAATVSISPNPTSDNLYVQNNTGRDLEIRITDLYGRALYSTRSNASVVPVPFKKLAAGLYLVIINEIGKRSSITRKILKQ